MQPWIADMLKEGAGDSAGMAPDTSLANTGGQPEMQPWIRDMLQEPDSRSVLQSTVAAPMPEMDFGRIIQAMDKPRDWVMKKLSGIEQEEPLYGADILKYAGWDGEGLPSKIGREAAGLVMDVSVDPLTLLEAPLVALKALGIDRRLGPSGARLARESAQTVAPRIGSSTGPSQSMMDALERPAFERQGRSVAGMEDVINRISATNRRSERLLPGAEGQRLLPSGMGPEQPKGLPYYLRKQPDQLPSGSLQELLASGPGAPKRLPEYMGRRQGLLPAQVGGPFEMGPVRDLKDELLHSIDTPGAGMLDDAIDPITREARAAGLSVEDYARRELSGPLPDVDIPKPSAVETLTGKKPTVKENLSVEAGQKEPWANAAVEDENRWYGTKVQVTPTLKRDKPYTGTVVRVLNNGEVVEVMPDGFDTTFRLSTKRISKIMSVQDSGPAAVGTTDAVSPGPTKLPTPKKPDPYRVAAEAKLHGIDRQSSYSKWVQATNLNPGMDAKDWQKIYDAASPYDYPDLAAKYGKTVPEVGTSVPKKGTADLKTGSIDTEKGSSRATDLLTGKTKDNAKIIEDIQRQIGAGEARVGDTRAAVYRLADGSYGVEITDAGRTFPMYKGVGLKSDEAKRAAVVWLKKKFNL